MKIEIQSDSSTANSLTDRLGARQRTKHIDTRYFRIQERVQDGDLSIKKVLTAKNRADVGTKPSLLQYYKNIASLQDWYYTDHGFPHFATATLIQTQRPDVITGKQENRNRQLSALIENIETDVQAE